MNPDSYYDGSGYDRETVAFYDVAHEGAQVRAVAGAVDALSGLYGMNPRSVVVLATGQVAHASARFVNAVRSPLRLPLVITDTLPGYVGPLDVVIVVGDRADAPDVSRALITADRRGAVTVLVGPARGPILDDAPAATITIPALPTVLGASPARAITSIGTVLDLLEEDTEFVTSRLEEIAQVLDEELEQLSPERDSMVNPGRQLREFADGARLTHTGRPGIGFAVAELVADLWTLKGIPSGAADLAELAAGAMSAPAAPPRDDIFHDPFLDGPGALLPLKTVVWAQEPEGPDAADTIPHALAVTCDTPGVGPATGALKLITRGLAAATYDLPDPPVEGY